MAPSHYSGVSISKMTVKSGVLTGNSYISFKVSRSRFPKCIYRAQLPSAEKARPGAMLLLCPSLPSGRLWLQLRSSLPCNVVALG